MFAVGHDPAVSYPLRTINDWFEADELLIDIFRRVIQMSTHPVPCAARTVQTSRRRTTKSALVTLGLVCQRWGKLVTDASVIKEQIYKCFAGRKTTNTESLFSWITKNKRADLICEYSRLDAFFENKTVGGWGQDCFRSSLEWAVKEGNFDLVKTLCEQSTPATATQILGVIRYSGIFEPFADYEGLWRMDEARRFPNAEMIKLMIRAVAKHEELLLREDRTLATLASLAALAGDLEFIHFLCEKGLFVDVEFNSCEDAPTPLHAAAFAGHIEVVKFLCEGGASLSKTDRGGFTSILRAASANRMEVVEYLCKRERVFSSAFSGIQEVILRQSGFGWEKFVGYLGRAGHVEIFRFLFEAIAKINRLDRFYDIVRNHAVNEAIWAGHVGLVEFLFERGATYNADTLIRVAAWAGRVDVVEFLCNRGASLEARDNQGPTPLHAAAKAGHVEMVGFLCNRGASLEARDNQGLTPLHAAAMAGHVEMVGFLCNRGASLEARDNQGLTPLHAAAMAGHVEMVGFLCNRGASLEARDNQGLTPLHAAAMAGHVEMVGFLCEKGASPLPPQAKDIDYLCLLHAAANAGDVKAVRFLCENGASLEKINSDGFSPLDTAIRCGEHDQYRCMEVVKYLCEKAASQGVKNQWYKTAFDLAFKVHGRSRPEFLAILFEHSGSLRSSLGIGKVGMFHIFMICCSICADLTFLGALKCLLGDKQTGPRELLIPLCGLFVLCRPIFLQLGLVCAVCEHRNREEEIEEEIKLIHLLGKVLTLVREGVLQKLWEGWKFEFELESLVYLAVTPGKVEWLNKCIQILRKEGISLEIRDLKGNGPFKKGYTPFELAVIAGHAEIVAMLYEQSGSLKSHMSPGNLALLFIICADLVALYVSTMQKDVSGEQVKGALGLILCWNLFGSPLILAHALSPWLQEFYETHPPGGVNSRRNNHYNDYTTKYTREYIEKLRDLGNVKVALRQEGFYDIDMPYDSYDVREERARTSLLHSAALQGDIELFKECVEILLKKGISLDVRDLLYGATSLHLAAEAGHTDIVRLLCEKSVSLDVRDRKGHTPLHLAALEGHAAAVRLLCEGGASLDSNWRLRSPLFEATKKRHFEVVEVLLEQGSSVRSMVPGKTSLHILAACVNALVVSANLLRKDSDTFITLTSSVLLLVSMVEIMARRLLKRDIEHLRKSQ